MTLSKEKLQETLAQAGQSHHEYETTTLNGIRDENWAAYYTGFILGRMGDFVKPSILIQWLSDAPLVKDWPESTARIIVEKLANS